MDFLWSLYDVIIEDYILGQIFPLGLGSRHYTQIRDWVKENVNLFFCNMIMASSHDVKMDHMVKINDFLLFHLQNCAGTLKVGNQNCCTQNVTNIHYVSFEFHCHPNLIWCHIWQRNSKNRYFLQLFMIRIWLKQYLW